MYLQVLYVQKYVKWVGPTYVSIGNFSEIQISLQHLYCIILELNHTPYYLILPRISMYSTESQPSSRKRAWTSKIDFTLSYMVKKNV